MVSFSSPTHFAVEALYVMMVVSWLLDIFVFASDKKGIWRDGSKVRRVSGRYIKRHRKSLRNKRRVGRRPDIFGSSVCSTSLCLSLTKFLASNWLCYKHYWNTDLSTVFPLAESWDFLNAKCFNKFSHISKCFHGFDPRTPEVRFEK